MPSRWGVWDPNTRTITLSRALIEGFSWDAVLDVLKHEVAHMIVNEEYNIPDHTHGDAFKRACRRLGISAWASASESDMAETVPGKDTTQLSEEDQRLLKRVEKLLALADSSNEHEALLAMQRVRELYSRYNLERLRTSSAQSEFTSVIINHQRKQISQHQSAIASILTAHFFVEVVVANQYHAASNSQFRVIELLGSKQNVLMAEYVYYFLLNKLETLWRDYKCGTDRGGVAKRSYFLGVLRGFDEKLSSQGAYKSQSGQTWHLSDVDKDTQALVAVADQELQNFVSYKHPRLVTRRISSTVRDYGSYEDGQKAGKDIVINKPIERSHSGGVGFLT